MKMMKKVLSVLICICMLMSSVAFGAVTVTETSYDFVLGGVGTKPGASVQFPLVDRMTDDPDVLFAMVYNSSHYDEDWVVRETPAIKYEKIYTQETITVEQETSPLKCVQMDHWNEETYVRGVYNLEFTVPDTLEPGIYYATVMTYPPEGKEIDVRVKPMTFSFRLEVAASIPGGGGSGEGETTPDRSVVSEKYYDAAKICYDLSLLPDVYTDYNKQITKEDMAYALIKILGMETQAKNMQNETSNIFTDLEKGTYLCGCANLLYQMGVLSGDSYGVFGKDTQMTYIQILKSMVDILGYSEYAKASGNYPTGYLRCANSIGIAISKGINDTVTGEEFAQIIYNTVESKIMEISEYTISGPVYKITDKTLLYELGYCKYKGIGAKNGNILTINGTEYTSDAPKGTAVDGKRLTIGDADVSKYEDSSMILYVKDDVILSGINYYEANVTVNNKEKTTDKTEVPVSFVVAGYTKYKVNDGEYKVIPETGTDTCTLTSGCGEKTLNITVANDSETKTKEFKNTITLKQYHKISYMIEDSLYYSENVLCGEAIPYFDAKPSMPGYDFVEWGGLPIVMPDNDVVVTAVYEENGEVTEPEPEVFEADLPDARGLFGESVVIENIQDLIPEKYTDGLCYASTLYQEYIYSDAVFTFNNGTEEFVYTQKDTPLIFIEYMVYNLEIPIFEGLEEGKYKLTISLDIAYEKESPMSKPYKFTINEFTVGYDPSEGGDEEPEDPQDSEIVFNVADTTDLSVISGAQITIGDKNGEIIKKITSDSTGKASVALPNGTYNVQILASGYEMRTFTVEKTDEKSEFSVYLNKNPLVTVQSSVKEMTKQEMIDAGIDVDAVENKHIYKCTTVLKFEPVASEGSIDITPIEINFDYVCDEAGVIIKAKEVYCDGMIIYPVSKDIYLIIHSEVTWLKEIFDVQLIVANTSVVETIKDCEINLNLPEGLSLAKMTGDDQSLKVNIKEIAPSSLSDTHWYICGDKKGEYILDGTVVGIREGGGISEDIKVSFRMQEPISVLAGDAMHLLIEAERFAEAGKPYKVRYTLENVSDKKLYDVVLNVIGGKFVKAYSIEELKHNGELVNLGGLSGTFNNGYELKAEEFNPGETLSGVFEIIFGQGVETDQIKYMVTQMFTFTGEGSTTEIPTDVVLVDFVCDHKYDDGEVTTQPTTTQTGIKTYKCIHCSDTKEKTVPKIGEVSFDESDKSVMMSCDKAYEDAKVLVSVYDSNGNLKGIKSAVIDINKGVTEYTFADFDIPDGDLVKVVAYEKMWKLRSLFKAYQLELK